MFERLRAAINAALDAATVPPDPREITALMREAVLEARTSVAAMQDAIRRTEHSLSVERRQLEDAKRRGRLAAGIEDGETVTIADQFAGKHGERVGVLERKLEAQRAELALAEQELAEMKTKLIEARRSQPQGDATRRVEAAWRELESSGGVRPETDVAGERLRAQFDRAAREAHAEAQLEALKKKMGQQKR